MPPAKKACPRPSQLATAMETLKLFSAFVDILEAFGPILEKHYG
ncbi:MAG: hypothetical protein ACR5LG_01630 [Sodalis sp. (in: enterobacteria)]